METNQVLSYHTYFQDTAGSGLIVQKPNNVGGLENVIHYYAAFGLPGATVDTAIVAAVATKKIRVVQFDIVATSAAGGSDVTFRSKPAGAGSNKTPAYYLAASEKFGRYFSPFGWFETNVGEGLSGSVVSANAIGGLVGYIFI